MATYIVSYMCVYTDVVEANSPAEAADKVEHDCPCDVDGMAHVTDENTWEEWDVDGDGNLYNYHCPEESE